jgi:transposase
MSSITSNVGIGAGINGSPGSDSDFRRLCNVVAGLDIHKSSIVACVLGHKDGEPDSYEIRKFGTFKRDIVELAAWLNESGVELAVVESTGIYWRNPYRLLQKAGLNTILVNSYRVKNVPGHKSDIEDSRWLAMLARAGLLPKSRVLEQDLEQMRELARMRQKYVEDQATFKNRIYKLLLSAGFNVSQVVTDLFGETGLIILHGIMNRQPPPAILSTIENTLGDRLKAPREVLLDALTGDMSNILYKELEALLETVEYMGGKVRYFESMLEEELNLRGLVYLVDLLETFPDV